MKQYDRWVCDVGIRGLQNMNLAAAGARVDHQNRRVQILDFSFCNLREMAQVFTAQPRSGRVRKRAVWGEQSQTTAPAPPSPAASDRPTDRLQSEHANADEEEEGVQEEAELIPQYYANALKLNNNQVRAVLLGDGGLAVRRCARRGRSCDGGRAVRTLGISGGPPGTDRTRAGMH